MAAIITPIWDEVYVSVYNFGGINPDYGLISTIPNYPRGVVAVSYTHLTLPTNREV